MSAKKIQAIRNDIHAGGKGVRDTINAVLDPLSFVEMDTFSFSSNVEGEAPGEGVVCGFGTVSGVRVYILAQNIDILKGSVSEAQANKIVRCINAADSAGAPLITMFDSYGARLGDPLGTLDGYAQIFSALTGISIPLLTVFKNKCYGMLASVIGLCDFCFMYPDALIAANSPFVLTGSNDAKTNKALFGAAEYSKNGGICEFAVSGDEDLSAKVRAVLGFIEGGADSADDPNRQCPEASDKCGIEFASVVLDKGSLLEIYQGYGAEAVTAFGYLDSVSVGIIVSAAKDAELTTQGMNKIARFVSLCAAFDIPVINFVDFAGISVDKNNQSSQLIAVSSMIRAYADHSLKISVVTGSAIGLAYTALVSKKMNYNFVLAFENAKIGALRSEPAARLMYKDELMKLNNSDVAIKELAKNYGEGQDIFYAAARGLVDNIIEPKMTRAYLIGALGMLI